MKRLLSILTLCAAAVTYLTAAQRIVVISGEEYIYYAPSSMSLEQAKREALQQTRLHIMEAKFGTNINSTTNIHLENDQTGENTTSRADVQTLSVHEVRGEWLEDTREPEQTIMYDNSMPNTTIIRTRIWGRAREVVTAKVDIDVHLLKDTIKGSDAEVFKNGQSFYLSFQSPVSGYVAVYLIDQDEDNAFCLLPAARDGRGAVPVKSNQRYVFFSEDYAKAHYGTEDQALGTEYMLTTERSVLFNQIYVIFSPSEFFKANDRQEKDDQYKLPRETTIQQFRKWLVASKTRDTQMVEQIFTVKIVK